MPNEKDDHKIQAIPVLKDNIVWAWTIRDQAVIVDPAVSEPVKTWLEAKGLSLNSILQTHHHEDHIGGTENLIKHWPKASVIASKDDIKRIPFQTISVRHGRNFSLLGYPIEVLGVAGHTKAHLAYYLPRKKTGLGAPALFCGDTLFGGGCGRLFEGTPKDMFKAMQLLNSLPAETKIYCAHEYTEENLKWANSLYPKDKLIEKRLANVKKIRKDRLLTLPSTISEERRTNLFLRARTVEELANLRQNKDNWKA